MKAAIKAVIGSLGYDLRRKGPPPAPGLGYLDLAETQEAALKAGLGVNAYLVRSWGTEGRCDAFLDDVAALGVFKHHRPRVVEIGPGTGIHLERIIERFNPSAYEIYETSEDWRDWLVQRCFPHVKGWPADGKTLHQTKDASTDVVLSVGTFVYLPFLTAAGYWEECCRIVRPGGHVVIDFLTESCMTDDLIQHWRDSGAYYPVVHCRSYIEAFFRARNCTPIRIFHRPFAGAISECMVFRRS